jgi:hypothetical protein
MTPAWLALVTTVTSGLALAGCNAHNCEDLRPSREYRITMIRAPEEPTWRGGRIVLASEPPGPWDAVIENASTAPPGSGLFTVVASDYGQLYVRMPFPVTAGQTFALRADPSSAIGPTLSFADPVTEATAFLSKRCKDPRQQPCDPAQEPEGQTITGTLEVRSVEPLELIFGAKITDGSDPSRPPINAYGDILFRIETGGEICADALSP